MKFEMASGCEWEWVATCCKKAKHLHQMRWETCRHNFCVIGAVAFGKLLQTTKKLDVCPGRTKDIQKIRNQEILKYYNKQQNAEMKYNFNYELRWTTNHHNSAVLRLERAPPSKCPSPNRPRYQTCVWMDPFVYECLDSVLRSQVHLLQRNAPNRAPSSPPWLGEARSPAARVACCARVWTDELCVLGCVRDWEYASLGENACRDGKTKKI